MEEKGEVIIYQSEDGNVQLDVHLENETVWLTIEQMSTLFGKARSTINEHILNAFQEGELQESDSVRKIGISDFSTKPTNNYNLDVVISVGYRVHSIAGTRFRQWATKRLREYIVKGWTLDVNRLKGNGGGQYWCCIPAGGGIIMYCFVRENPVFTHEAYCFRGIVRKKGCFTHGVGVGCPVGPGDARSGRA